MHDEQRSISTPCSTFPMGANVADDLFDGAKHDVDQTPLEFGDALFKNFVDI